jgi:hypothetical protein
MKPRANWLRSLGAWLVPALVFALLGASARAQSDARVSAHLSTGVVRLGDRISLVVTVENAEQAELRELPQVDGLTLGPIGTPMSASSAEYGLNGRRSRSFSLTWAIPVRPNQTGDFTIPSFNVVVARQTLSTNPLTLTVVADLKGEELGFLEIRASSKRVVEGQPFSIEVVCGFDQALQNKVNYFNLALPWWNELPGVLEMEAPPSRPGAKEYQIDLNSRERVDVEMIDARTVKGRPFYQLRAVRSFTPTRTGTIDIPTSFFEFGSVVEHRDFFRTTREKGETYFAKAPALSIEVVPLPDQGRPLEFSGAIGQFAAKASAEPRDVDAGESIKFVVEWSGSGNLEFFTPPDPARLDAFRSFRVYGKTEQKSFDRRTVTYDLSPISSEVHEIPALPLSVYDPAQERYTVLGTDPIAIRVRALEGATGLAPSGDEQRFAQDVRDIVMHARPASGGGALGTGLVLGALGAVPIGWLALRTAVRRRGDPDAPAERARRKARKQLMRALANADDARAQLDVVSQFLGARTGEAPQAWIGRGLEEALARNDKLDRARVKPLFDVIGELDRTAWGGEGSAQPRERIVQAAEEAVRGGL